MTKHTLHSDALNPHLHSLAPPARAGEVSFTLRAGLLPLRIALIAAEKDSPARPPRQPRDPNEQLALQLIEKIKHPGQISFTGLKIESPQPLFAGRFPKMAGTHAG